MNGKRFHITPYPRLGYAEEEKLRYEACFYDVWNCELTDKQVIGTNENLYIREWTAITLKLMED
jgi:hypothetical protein